MHNETGAIFFLFVAGICIKFVFIEYDYEAMFATRLFVAIL